LLSNSPTPDPARNLGGSGFGTVRRRRTDLPNGWPRLHIGVHLRFPDAILLSAHSAGCGLACAALAVALGLGELPDGNWGCGSAVGYRLAGTAHGAWRVGDVDRVDYFHGTNPLAAAKKIRGEQCEPLHSDHVRRCCVHHIADRP